MNGNEFERRPNKNVGNKPDQPLRVSPSQEPTSSEHHLSLDSKGVRGVLFLTNF